MLLNLSFKVLSFRFTRRRFLFILALLAIVLMLLAATRVTTAIWRQWPPNTPEPVDNDLAYDAPMRTAASDYYVSPEGNNDWPGTFGQPWRTLQHAGAMLQAGDTLYIRGGIYVLGYSGVDFHHSGTAESPITVTNFSGEQVIIQGVENTDPGTQPHHERLYRYGFICFQAQGQFPTQADHIHVVGTDLADPQPIPASDTNPTLYRTSRKGIVMLNFDVAIRGEGCNYWEVSGLEMFNCGMCGDGYLGTCSTSQAHEGYCIFTTRGAYDGNAGLDQPQTTNFWNVHDNVIYNAAEVPLQLNGDFNVIERNDIFHGEIYGDNGSQGPPIILLGHHNIVRHNFLHDSGQSFGGYGGDDHSWGLLLENDMADDNLVEGNVIFNTQEGIAVWGGDNNLIRNNIVFTEDWYDMTNEYAFGLITAQKGCDSTPAQHPYCPGGDQYNNCQYINNGADDCFPENNQFYHNTVYGFQIGMACGCEFGCSNSCNNTRFGNNALGSFQYLQQNYGSAVFEDNLSLNGVVSVPDRDFRLLPNSTLIDAGVELGTCDVPDLANSTHDNAAVRTEPCAGTSHIGLTQACIEAIRDRPDDHRIGVDDLATCFVSEPREWSSATDVGAYEHSDGAWVIKTADRDALLAGERLNYTIRVTNTISGTLTATVTDILPDHITAGETATGSLLLPGSAVTWTATIPTPGGVWTSTVAVTVEIGYAGLLNNVVKVTTDKGATEIYTSTVLVARMSLYLPLTLKH